MLVQPLRRVAGHGVEHEQRLALGLRLAFGFGHQPLRNPAAPCGAADEELRDVGAVRLIRRQREDDLDGADDLAVLERGQQ